MRVTVSDDGEGMGPEVVAKAMEAGFTTKGRDATQGLGLSVSHGIVREHRGELEVESQPGEFTRFFLNLRVDNGWGLEF